MPNRLKCKCCGGTYLPIQSDGTTYRHACAPVTVQGKQPDPTKPGYTPPESRERENRRDENLMIDGVTGQHRIISEGLGVEEVA